MSDEISRVEPKVEAVFAPGLPPIAQKLYGDDPDDFTAAGSPAPTKQSGIEAERGVQVAAFVFFAVVAVGLWFGSRWFFGLFLPDPVVLGLSITIGVVEAVFLACAMFAVNAETEGRKVGREHHGKYLLPDDFDGVAQPLMIRAEEAVKAVRAAEVSKRGLLDAIEHEVVLPEQLWDIGLLLHRQSVLRARLREVRGGVDHPSVYAVLQPQRDALDQSVAAAVNKVEALERYAAKVRDADGALLAQGVLREALQDSDKYLELLATTGSAADTSLIDELGEDASKVTDMLTQSIAEVHDTGLELLRPIDKLPPADKLRPTDEIRPIDEDRRADEDRA